MGKDNITNYYLLNKRMTFLIYFFCVYGSETITIILTDYDCYLFFEYPGFPKFHIYCLFLKLISAFDLFKVLKNNT